MQPQLPIAEYEFTYRAVGDIRIPPFPGKLLHGAFGNALYKSSCIAPDIECRECMFKGKCAYTSLFKSQHFPLSGSIQGLVNTPSPHIFRYQQQYFRRISKNQCFNINMIIVGNVNRNKNELIQAMTLLGTLGIHRKQAKLIHAVQSTTQSLLPTQLSSIAQPRPKQPVLVAMPDVLRIRFLTPHIPQGKAIGKDFNLGLWLMAIIRRITLLQNIYTDTPVSADFKYLKQLTEDGLMINPQLYWYETPQTRAEHSSGFLGSFDLNMNPIKSLWPWLYLGQWTHCGKRTSHGNGRYYLSAIK